MADLCFFGFNLIPYNWGDVISLCLTMFVQRDEWYDSCRGIRDSCLPDDKGEYDANSCVQARRTFRDKNCIDNEGGLAEFPGESVAVPVSSYQATMMREVRRGERKTFFCCSQKDDDNEYGFLQMPAKLREAELIALAALVKGDDALDASHIVVAYPVHSEVEGSLLDDDEWASPNSLKTKTGTIVAAGSGYWVRVSTVMIVLEPRAQSLNCDPKIVRALRVTLDEDERGLVHEELEYMKAHLSKICSIMGDVKLFIEIDGRVRLSAKAPGENGETCAGDIAVIAQGIDKCTEQIRTLDHVLPNAEE